MADKAGLERAKVSAMFGSAESLREYPSSYHPTLQRAQEMLKAWRIKYPEAAAEEKRVDDELDRQEKEDRASAFATSFIGQGLD